MQAFLYSFYFNGAHGPFSVTNPITDPIPNFVSGSITDSGTNYLIYLIH